MTINILTLVNLVTGIIPETLTLVTLTLIEYKPSGRGCNLFALNQKKRNYFWSGIPNSLWIHIQFNEYDDSI